MDNQWSDDEYSLNNIFDTLKYDVDEKMECLSRVTGVFKARGHFDDVTPKYGIGLEDELGRSLIIIVSPTDASSVNDQLNEEQSDRPLSHDLIMTIIREMGGCIVSAVIDDVWQQTFYSKIRVRLPDGRIKAIDSRPSDAIVMALKSGTSIYICERVLKYAQQMDSE